MKDAYGLDVATDSAAALDAYEKLRAAAAVKEEDAHE